MQENLNGFLSTPYIFPFYFAALWCFISFSVSFMSGWFALSGRFKKESEPYGPTKSAGPFFYTVYMRFGTHYSSVIQMTAAEDSLYLSALFLFRIGHPPLRIPWDEIQVGRAKFLWICSVHLTLGKEEQIPMRMSERMARKLGILERIPNQGILPPSPTSIL